MAEVYTCDRCGMITQPSNLDSVRYYTGFWNGYKEIDLCPICAKKYKKLIKKFLDEGREPDIRQQGY